MSTTKVQKRDRNSANGASATPEALADATAYEAQIAKEAAGIRGDAKELTPALFMELWPLLRRPIPEGFIVATEAVTGKPYPSTGVKSVQVLTDRMDNVLTPLWWWDETEYTGEGSGPKDVGTLARVTVHVGSNRVPILSRGSHGGVDRASTLGNLWKGTYTNAAKRAFAAVGPGHEIYLGTTDLDPDVSPDAAKAQERPVTGSAPVPPRPTLPESDVSELAGIAKQVLAAGAWDSKQLSNQLIAAGATDKSSVGAALRTLKPEQADQLKSALVDLLAVAEEGS